MSIQLISNEIRSLASISPKGVRVYVAYIRDHSHIMSDNARDQDMWHPFVAALGFGSRIRGAVVGNARFTCIGRLHEHGRYEFEFSKFIKLYCKATILHANRLFSKKLSQFDTKNGLWKKCSRLYDDLLEITRPIRHNHHVICSQPKWGATQRTDGEHPERPPSTPTRSLSLTMHNVIQDNVVKEERVKRVCCALSQCTKPKPGGGTASPSGNLTFSLICRFHPDWDAQYVIDGRTVCEGGMCAHVMSLHICAVMDNWDTLVVGWKADHIALGARTVYTCFLLNTTQQGKCEHSQRLTRWMLVYAWTRPDARNCRHTRTALYEIQCLASKQNINLIVTERWSWIGYQLCVDVSTTEWLSALGFRRVDHPSYSFALAVIDYNKGATGTIGNEYNLGSTCAEHDEDGSDEEFVVEARDEGPESPYAPKAFEISLSKMNETLINATIRETQQYMLSHDQAEASRFVEAFLAMKK